MLVAAETILPSQDFLKPGTIRFIFDCIRTGNTDQLPPTPLVRTTSDGKLVAIDGHNLIAVRHFLNQKVEVIPATSPHDGLLETTAANIERNKELAAKYDTVLDEQRRVATEGIHSFADLIAKYPNLFIEPAASY